MPASGLSLCFGSFQQTIHGIPRIDAIATIHNAEGSSVIQGSVTMFRFGKRIDMWSAKLVRVEQPTAIVVIYLIRGYLVVAWSKDGSSRRRGTL